MFPKQSVEGLLLSGLKQDYLLAACYSSPLTQVLTLVSVDLAAFLAISSFFQGGISGSFALVWGLLEVRTAAVVPLLFRSISFFFHSGRSVEEEDDESFRGPV